MKSKLISILLSLAIALGLWVYVITVVDPEYERTTNDVKVVLQNQVMLEDRNLMILEQTESVSLRLKGNRTTLVSVVSDDLSVQANVANITEPGEYKLPYKVSLPDSVPSGAVTVQKQDPDMVVIKVETKMTAEIPFKADTTGTVPEGFEPEDAVFEPEMLQITGPESVVSQIKYAKLDEPINIAGRTDSVAGEYTYTLCDKDGNPVDVEHITTNVQQVTARVRIRQVKDLKLTLKITPGGGLTEKDVTIEPGTIRICGNKTVLEELGDSFQIGELDLSALDSMTQPEPFPVVLPEGVENRSGVEEAKVTIDFGDLTHKTLTVNKFNVVPPEATSAVLDTYELRITLRGPKDLMENITEKDLTVTVDYSDLQTGSVTRKAIISVSSEFQGVEAVGGPYEISATLRRKN